MKQAQAIICAAAATALLASPASARPQLVTNAMNAGAGSFRAAIQEANLDASINAIVFRGRFNIVLDDTVEYQGEQSLRIDGRGSTIDGDEGAFDLFLASGGGDLDLTGLTFQNSGENGVVVRVPSHAQGAVSVSLTSVTIADNARFGLLIDDLTESSKAGVDLSVHFSRITGNGLDEPDLDGIRVDEGDDGDITATIHYAEITGNGADGLELDESGIGDVVLFARHTAFDGNGQNPDDADDGVDIDEADEGDVWFRIVRSTFNDNTDDGIDMDEDAEGDMHASLVRVQVLDNGDKGVNLGENGPGDFKAAVNLVRVEGNGFVSSGADAGLRMREFDEGEFFARVVRSTVAENDLDIEVEEDGDGDGILRLQHVKYGTIDPAGVTVIEVP